jgi:GWxTD domain-containing protein
MMYKKYKKLILVVIFIPFLFGFCSKSYNSKKDLSKEERDFISEVRYIIKKQEKKRFFSLVTAEQRKEFIADFWKKRDPDLSTDENEFKIEYYKLIEEANHLFKGEGEEGWLTDRGRVYILLGPPDLRRFRPGEISSSSVKDYYNYPREEWFYGYYPILFIDRFENGRFVLTPLSAAHVSTILKTALDFKPTVAKGKKEPYDFTINLKKEKENQVNLRLNVPYKNILFQQADDHFSAVLTLYVDIFDSHDKKIQNFSKEYTVSLTKEELKTTDNVYIIVVPITLSPGKYQLQTILESKADDIRSKKRIKFKI